MKAYAEEQQKQFQLEQQQQFITIPGSTAADLENQSRSNPENVIGDNSCFMICWQKPQTRHGSSTAVSWNFSRRMKKERSKLEF